MNRGTSRDDTQRPWCGRTARRSSIVGAAAAAWAFACGGGSTLSATTGSDAGGAPQDSGGTSDIGAQEGGGSQDGSAPSDDGGGTDAGGYGHSDSGVAFQPCPANGAACAILPLGDSITDGYPFEMGGYRVELFHQANINNQLITFVGSLANGPTNPLVDGKTFPRNHEGHSGFTIDNAADAGRSGISPLTDQAIATTKPDIVLLMIGTNDVNLNYNLDSAPTRLAALVDRIIADAPNALLAVAQLVPTQTDAENVAFQAYNAAIPNIVDTRAAAGKHVIRIDMYAAFADNPNFKSALMNDNLHPNAAGYTLLGQTWYGAIRSYL